MDTAHTQSEKTQTSARGSAQLPSSQFQPARVSKINKKVRPRRLTDGCTGTCEADRTPSLTPRAELLELNDNGNGLERGGGMVVRLERWMRAPRPINESSRALPPPI